MKTVGAAIALLATALVAGAAVATEPTNPVSDTVVTVCKRHMIGLGPNYESKFRLCAYLAGAVESVRAPSDRQRDAQDFAAIQAYLQAQNTDQVSERVDYTP
jgi:hypothetical protein